MVVNNYIHADNLKSIHHRYTPNAFDRQDDTYMIYMYAYLLLLFTLNFTDSFWYCSEEFHNYPPLRLVAAIGNDSMEMSVFSNNISDNHYHLYNFTN